jgi:hypothetical protein
MKRWICPMCQAGKLAPERPRRDDVRRYCLPCSQTTGRLVERACPALDRKRAAKKERQAAKRATARDRQAAADLARYTVGTPATGVIDLRDELRRLMRLPCVKALCCNDQGRRIRDGFGAMLQPRLPRLQVYRRQVGSHTTGRGVYGQPWRPGRIHLTVGDASTPASAWELLAHEYLHVIGYRHGHRMNAMLAQVVHERWAVDVYRHGYDGRKNFGTYNLDHLIVKALRDAGALS